MTQIHTAAPIEYRVQVSTAPTAKSSYRTKYSVTDLSDAYFWYIGINIGRGYKKRLIAYSPEFKTTKLLERSFS